MLVPGPGLDRLSIAVFGLVYLRPRFIWVGRVGLGLRTLALVATFGQAQSLFFAATSGELGYHAVPVLHCRSKHF